jgi:hypothetical protein
VEPRRHAARRHGRRVGSRNWKPAGTTPRDVATLASLRTGNVDGSSLVIDGALINTV